MNSEQLEAEKAYNLWLEKELAKGYAGTVLGDDGNFGYRMWVSGWQAARSQPASYPGLFTGVLNGRHVTLHGSASNIEFLSDYLESVKQPTAPRVVSDLQLDFSVNFMDGWLQDEREEVLRNWENVKRAALESIVPAQPSVPVQALQTLLRYDENVDPHDDTATKVTQSSTGWWVKWSDIEQLIAEHDGKEKTE